MPHQNDRDTKEALPGGYARVNRKRFLGTLRPLLPVSRLKTIEAAYYFSKYGHRNQTRDCGVRYFEHPKSVAWILISELRISDWQVITMALLHDILEDSFLLERNRIEKNFGKAVAVGVQLLTKRPKRGYIRRMIDHGDWRVLTAKLADRLHNLRTLGACLPEKRRKQINETRKLILPLADLLMKKLPAKNRWRAEYLKNQIMAECEKWG